MTDQKIYGGIYKQGPSKSTDSFLMDSVMSEMENKLAPYYLWETIAHNLMLVDKNIIPRPAAKKILKELLEMVAKLSTSKLVDPKIGDIHENIEKQLNEKIGVDAGWFHIARSRNDQTVTDQKLFMKKHLFDFFGLLAKLEKIMLEKSKKYSVTIMPGFTHLRSAMPSSFGFWWQSYLEQLIDLHEVLKNIFLIYDKSPLGAGASYGVNWPIDPEMTAKNLGFSQSFDNALCAINNRGIDDATVISILAVFMTVMSRMMDDVIIWSMPELNYINISEQYTSGSSIMPQKMNPDIAEKIRSKSAKMIANLNNVLIAMKGTPSGYNRDSAESKIAIISSLEESINTILIASEMLASIIPNSENMKKAVVSSLPTKLADELVKKYQIPFRIAHKIVGKTVAMVQGNIAQINNAIVKAAIKEVTGNELNINKQLIGEVFNVDKALNQYQCVGSAGKSQEKVNGKLVIIVNKNEQWVSQEKEKFKKAEQKTYAAALQFIGK